MSSIVIGQFQLNSRYQDEASDTKLDVGVDVEQQQQQDGARVEVPTRDLKIGCQTVKDSHTKQNKRTICPRKKSYANSKHAPVAVNIPAPQREGVSPPFRPVHMMRKG